MLTLIELIIIGLLLTPFVLVSQLLTFTDDFKTKSNKIDFKKLVWFIISNATLDFIWIFAFFFVLDLLIDFKSFLG